MTNPAELPLDDDDQAILDRLAEVYARLDPPPADLDERVSFAIALAGVDAEVARLSDQLMVGSGARGSERTRTITFDADSRTVMITSRTRPTAWSASTAGWRRARRCGSSCGCLSRPSPES